MPKSNKKTKTDTSPYRKADSHFKRVHSLGYFSIRFDRVSGRGRLTIGTDCEDGMADFRMLDGCKK